MTLENLKTYTCIQCKLEYQSDGLKKPKSFRKDGSVCHTYDSKLFCSKECCIKQSREKHKQTLRNHPEILKKQKETLKQTLRDHPEIIEKQKEKRKQTFRDCPEIKKQISESLKQAYKDHPEIIEKQKETHKQTLRNHPEILERAGEKISQNYKDRPEIRKQISESLKQAYKDHPEIREKQREAYKQTLRDYPEIMKKRNETHRQTLRDYPEIMKKREEKRQLTLLNHPEIIEQACDRAYQTAKESGFVSKEEFKMIQLLRNKYGEDDILEQYRDDRYKHPDKNYRFACDCYIRSLDLFIEYNGSRFHPKEEDRDKLLKEIERFKLKYPNRDIKQCQAYTLLQTIENDKIKQQVARGSRLNYLVVTDGYRELYDTGILKNL